MGRLLRWLVVIALVGAGVGWFLTRPETIPESTIAGLVGDPVHGRDVFNAAGCASCHSVPGVPVSNPPVLAGGRKFTTAFGTFVAPNITPDGENGIGDWTDIQIVTAIMRGVDDEGQHLYPAFPYDTYAKATPQDMVDLVAYLRTVPPDAKPSQPHSLSFPFSIRRAVGGWKLLFRSDDWVLQDAQTSQLERGRYLVEALGHCGECHTPRNFLGGPKRDMWLAGAPNPEGAGRIPNITPGGLNWSEADIAAYLKTGFTPDFDSAGGSMAEVVKNMAQLADEDRAAIAAYLKAIPAIETATAAAPSG
ncbi:MAG: cytochrome c [Rhodobacterales bacterium]|nr:cytochrome c [Rhodobacterales bacterium]